jgi:hypothetical protein
VMNDGNGACGGRDHRDVAAEERVMETVPVLSNKGIEVFSGHDERACAIRIAGVGNYDY